MALRTEVDSATGITRQINDDYRESLDLPGATVVPSSKGRYGATHAKTKRSLNQTIFLGDSKSMEIDITRYTRRQIAEVTREVGPGNTIEIYRRLKQLHGEGIANANAQRPTNTPAAPPSLAQTAEPPPQQARAARPEAPQPPEPLDTAPEPSLPLAAPSDPVERLLSVLSRAIRQEVSAAIQAEIPKQPINEQQEEVMSKLQQELSREQEELEQGQERLAAQGQVAHDKHQALVKGEQPATAPEPTVQVTLSRPGSMTIVSHYHEAIVSNDGGMQVVLLVYDESFRYGSRVFPPEDNDGDEPAPYRLVIQPHDGSDATTLPVINPGIAFRHRGQHYQMYFVAPKEEPEASE